MFWCNSCDQIVENNHDVEKCRLEERIRELEEALKRAVDEVESSLRIESRWDETLLAEMKALLAASTSAAPAPKPRRMAAVEGCPRGLQCEHLSEHDERSEETGECPECRATSGCWSWCRRPVVDAPRRMQANASCYAQALECPHLAEHDEIASHYWAGTCEEHGCKPVEPKLEPEPAPTTMDDLCPVHDLGGPEMGYYHPCDCSLGRLNPKPEPAKQDAMSAVLAALNKEGK